MVRSCDGNPEPLASPCPHGIDEELGHRSRVGVAVRLWLNKGALLNLSFLANHGDAHQLAHVEFPRIGRRTLRTPAAVTVPPGVAVGTSLETRITL